MFYKWHFFKYHLLTINNAINKTKNLKANPVAKNHRGFQNGYLYR